MSTSVKSRRTHETVRLLQKETPIFMLPEMWPLNSPDLNSVDYSISGILQNRVYLLQIHDVKDLKECLLREWRLLDHFIITTVIAQWRNRLSACVHVNGRCVKHKF